MLGACLLFCTGPSWAQNGDPSPGPEQGARSDVPLRVGVAGLTHGHVGWVFGSAARGDVEITGIVEPDREVARKYCEQYKFPLSRVYDTFEQLFAAGIPEAVAAFGPIRDHRAVVAACAPRGIHVMVEKPLAMSLEDAREMAALARKHRIRLLTNYETTWYPTNHRAYELLKRDTTLGSVRKIVVRDGHRGPKKIGVPPEFLGWLTDPGQNGAGALTDFGCYGANLITWLMEGQRPRSVTALTAQLQPENNPRVDDEAIILLRYPEAVGIIQASWNWPIGRKDLVAYGLYGAVYADNRHDLRLRMARGYDGFDETTETLPERQAPLNDPFLYLKAVVRGELDPGPNDLSSLENNLVVMEILDAAMRSAAAGKTIELDPEPTN
ncbi:Gfo/Idh/MocA family oxidoreductase [Robiginitalea sp. SC105]|nr:Gfo/Idh/MocA family oxidoreductase [Robiginitalea sp. SC105]MBC2838696.1 Gfo/Idh/MocA family oxidoreductase [Robiginitalea sp. SC105]